MTEWAKSFAGELQGQVVGEEAMGGTVDKIPMAALVGMAVGTEKNNS
jgi:hypothetical protein